MKNRAAASPSAPPHPYASLAQFKWALAALSVAVSMRYLWWRTFHSLNYASTTHLALSTALLLAEAYGVLSTVLFFLHAIRPEPVEPVPPGEPLPSVDVFVVIYNEPVDILYRTLVACAALDYPKNRLNVYVLDDGPRQAVREVAERFGFHYVTRPDRLHAKAGNMNNGLKLSRGEIVLALDCDHIPVRSLLKETVGFFKDQAVAFVQLPHHFYNPDSFQRNLHLENDLTNEQDLFFQVIQPGRQSSNAVMFAGSSTLLRRSALEAIGGIQVATAIEDTHTGMRLQAKGYKAVYYPRILSGALSPESFSGYLTQRNRWTRGGVQIFVLDNPLFRSGLSLVQRLHYFASVLYFFHGWARLIFLATPLTFLLAQYSPIVADIRTILSYFLPHYIFAHLTLAVMTREIRNPFWSDVYEAATSFSLSWTALTTMLNPEKLVFKVTPKGGGDNAHGRVAWTFVLPHTILLVLLMLGIGIETHRVVMTGQHVDAFLLSCFWAVFNIILLGCSIEAARERIKLRKQYRLKRSIPCELDFDGSVLTGTTSDISESGISAWLEDRCYVPLQCKVRLRSDFGEVTEVPGEVVRKDWPAMGGTSLGIRFPELTEETRQSIIRQIFSSPSSWQAIVRPPASHSLRSLWHIITSVVWHRFRSSSRASRAWPRIITHMPCELAMNGKTVPGTICDISAVGASVTISRDRSVAKLPGEVLLRFNLGESEIKVQSKTVRSIQDSHGSRHMFRFSDPSFLDISSIVREKNFPGA